MSIVGFGVCTWMFGEMALGEVAARVAALGYEGVELLGEVEKYRAAEASHILRDRGLAVFSLTPLDVDLAHPDDTIRRQALDYYYSLLDFASQLHAPLISCHGAVGRIRSLVPWEQEWKLMVEGVREVAARAESLGLRVAMELLNRYESHLLNTTEQGLRFIDQVALPNVGLNLDAYHMNIEEPNLEGAVRAAGSHLFLFHAADSNRQSVGRGHTDFASLIHALNAIAYAGPIILECPAPGPDPFQAVKDDSSVPWVETYLRESRERLGAMVRRR